MTMEALGTAQRPWVPNDSSFAARLAMVRWRMGWNVKEAALACGIAPSTWRLWEEQDAQPHKLVAVCKAIAARTGCDYNWLLDGEASPSAQPAVNRPIRYSVEAGPSRRTVSPGTYSYPKSQPDQATPKVSRPRDTRPTGRPKSPVVPPAFRRPSPRDRMA